VPARLKIGLQALSVAVVAGLLGLPISGIRRALES
jgi:hypothetical protein